jgi:hypothetical protein
MTLDLLLWVWLERWDRTTHNLSLLDREAMARAEAVWVVTFLLHERVWYGFSRSFAFKVTLSWNGDATLLIDLSA